MKMQSATVRRGLAATLAVAGLALAASAQNSANSQVNRDQGDSSRNSQMNNGERWDNGSSRYGLNDTPYSGYDPRYDSQRYRVDRGYWGDDYGSYRDYGRNSEYSNFGHPDPGYQSGYGYGPGPGYSGYNSYWRYGRQPMDRVYGSGGYDNYHRPYDNSMDNQYSNDYRYSNLYDNYGYPNSYGDYSSGDSNPYGVGTDVYDDKWDTGFWDMGEYDTGEYYTNDWNETEYGDDEGWFDW
jgi:hypothetical protein